jgi:hypothetical protein
MLCWVSTKDPVISGIDLLANQEEFIDVFWVAAKNQGGRATDEPDPMVHLCPQDPIAESQTGHRSGEASSVVRALVTRSCLVLDDSSAQPTDLPDATLLGKSGTVPRWAIETVSVGC